MPPAIRDFVSETATHAVPLWGTLLALAGIAMTVSLGVWQLGRAEHKREMQARIDGYATQPAHRMSGNETRTEELLLHRVEATGRYDVSKQVLLDNRVYQGKPGFHVITPLQLDGTQRHVLVNRGWVAQAGERTRLPVITTPSGTVQVRGTAVEGATKYVELADTTPAAGIWQNLVIERYRKASGLDVLPFIVQQEARGAPDDGLVRDWPPADLKRNTNLAYAAQWFGMALAIFIYITFLHVRARRRTLRTTA